MDFIHHVNMMADELYRSREFDHYKYYHVHATVRKFKPYINDVVYEGCPLNYCKKKVHPTYNGYWYCEKCHKYYSYFRYRYKLKAYLDDGTWRPFLVTMFDNIARPFLGINAPNLAKVYDDGYYEKYSSFFNDAMDQKCHFILRVALIRYKDSNNRQRVYLNGIVVKFWYDR